MPLAYAITSMSMTSHNYQSSRKNSSRFFPAAPFLRKFFSLFDVFPPLKAPPTTLFGVKNVSVIKVFFMHENKLAKSKTRMKKVFFNRITRVVFICVHCAKLRRTLRFLKCKTRKIIPQYSAKSTWASLTGLVSNQLRARGLYKLRDFSISFFLRSTKNATRKARRNEIKEKNFSFNVFNGSKSNNFMSIYYVCVSRRVVAASRTQNFSLNAVFSNFIFGIKYFVIVWARFAD